MGNENDAFSFEDSPSPGNRPRSRASSKKNVLDDSFDFDDNDRTLSPIPKDSGAKKTTPINEDLFDLETQPPVTSTPRVARKPLKPPPLPNHDDDVEFLDEVPSSSRKRKTPASKVAKRRKLQKTTPPKNFDFFDDDDFLISPEKTLGTSRAEESRNQAIEVIDLDDSFGSEVQKTQAKEIPQDSSGVDRQKTTAATTLSPLQHDSFGSETRKTIVKKLLDDSFELEHQKATAGTTVSPLERDVGGLERRKTGSTQPLTEQGSSGLKPQKTVTLLDDSFDAEPQKPTAGTTQPILDDSFEEELQQIEAEPILEDSFGELKSPAKVDLEDSFDFSEEKQRDSFEDGDGPIKHSEVLFSQKYAAPSTSNAQAPQKDGQFDLMEDSFRYSASPPSKKPGLSTNVSSPEPTKKLDEVADNVKRYKKLKKEAEDVEVIAKQLSIVMRTWREMEECLSWRRKPEVRLHRIVEGVELDYLANGQAILTLTVTNPATDDLDGWAIGVQWTEIGKSVTSSEAFDVGQLPPGSSAKYRLAVDLNLKPVLLKFNVFRMVRFDEVQKTFRIALDPCVFSHWNTARLRDGTAETANVLRHKYGNFELQLPIALLHLLNGKCAERSVTLVYAAVFPESAQLSSVATATLHCDVRKTKDTWREVILAVDRAPSAYTLSVFCKDPDFRRELEHELKVKLIVEMSKLKCRKPSEIQILLNVESLETLFTSLLLTFT